MFFSWKQMLASFHSYYLRYYVLQSLTSQKNFRNETWQSYFEGASLSRNIVKVWLIEVLHPKI